MSDKFKRKRGLPTYTTKEGYEMQTLYNGESCVVIASTVKVGGTAPPQHRHEHSDQLYYLTEGQMRIQLGAEEFDVGPDSVVFIPQGTPHHNWNIGSDDEFHFEVLSPAPLITQPAATLTDDTELVDKRPLIRTLDEVGFTEALPGFSTAYLLTREHGSEQMTLYVANVEPGRGGPPMHVHAFDQFYYVLEGELTVEVGVEELVAGPHELVILPAGVPHRQRNDSHMTERHLALLVPEPTPGDPWDFGVNFSLSGELY